MIRHSRHALGLIFLLLSACGEEPAGPECDPFDSDCSYLPPLFEWVWVSPMTELPTCRPPAWKEEGTPCYKLRVGWEIQFEARHDGAPMPVNWSLHSGFTDGVPTEHPVQLSGTYGSIVMVAALRAGWTELYVSAGSIEEDNLHWGGVILVVEPPPGS